MSENKPLTVTELQEKLDAMGIPYNKKAKLEELQALYDETQRPFEVVPGQVIKVMTKDAAGKDIEGEMELDLLMGSDEVIIQLKADKAELESTNKNLSEQLVTAAEFIDERDDTINVLEKENKQLKADKAELEGKNKALNDKLITTAEFSDVLEKENRILKANQPAKADAEALEAKEDISLGTGDNVANVSTVIGLDSRIREGFTFTRKTATYYLSDDELATIKADNHLIIHGEVTKREVE